MNADQPAFPVIGDNLTGTQPACGLTKREYFAAMAMQGFCNRVDQLEISDERIAILSIEQADEILRQLETTKP